MRSRHIIEIYVALVYVAISEPQARLWQNFQGGGP